MDMLDARPPVKFTFFDLVAMWLAGVDKETMASCPKRDLENVVVIALLMMGVWIYQTALFSLVTHKMLTDGTSIHPELIVASAFVATLVLLIDSYMVMRSGWHLHGISEIKRGGLDISGGLGPQVRNGIFLALRIILSLGIAQLMAVFMSLVLFAPDVGAQLDRDYQQQNAGLIATEQARADDTIAQAKEALTTETARQTALDAQVSAMRRGTVDPGANDAVLTAALADVDRLTQAKAAADTELSAAETFAANEIAGIKGGPGNTGTPGNGPVRKGAEERVVAAKVAATTAAQELVDARDRVDALRQRSAGQSDDLIKQAKAQLPALEAQLSEETTHVSTMRTHLDDLTRDRDGTVRAAVENSPNFVGHNTGLLGQLAALKAVATEPEVWSVIILIDVTSFGLELAAVLAKITSFIPTTYSALLARDAYMRTVGIVGEMDRVLRGIESPEEDDGVPQPEFLPPDDDNDQGNGGAGSPDSATPATGTSIARGNDDVPPKRPRGRPRKSPLN